MRYDLAFFLCCCKSFFGSTNVADGDDFYSLLGLDQDATQDEIKRAYKRQSLQMHPDKLAQRGKTVTEADQARFTRMKEAYEVLSDPHKRETYDAIGERGMKWLEEPFGLDPQELAHNFATSSVLDRSKIFAIFVGIFIAIFLLPFLVCLQIDGAFGPNASWVGILFPLWIWDIIILFYHSRVIMMGPIARPDHVPPEEWVDPLPMKKRFFSMARFALIVVFEFMAAMKMDDTLTWPWAGVFIPLYIWEATTLYKKLPLARMRIVTVEDLEMALGKPFSEFTSAEKELIAKRYSVVPSTTSQEFEAAQKLKTRARHDMIKSGFRIFFVLLLLLQLDGDMNWSWWFVFAPFWIMTGLFCYANYQAFSEVRQMAMEKDPSLFGLNKDSDIERPPANYGAVGKDGDATAAATSESAGRSDLTIEEQEELKAQVMASSSRLCSKCCSQGFLLLIVMLFVGKIQGADYSSVWVISPFLMIAGIILCCLGCAIFGITEVPTDGVDFDTGELSASSTAETPMNGVTPVVPFGANYVPPVSNTTPEGAQHEIAGDSETGEVEKSPDSHAVDAVLPIPEDKPEPVQLPQPVDLLDNCEGRTPNHQVATGINELD